MSLHMYGMDEAVVMLSLCGCWFKYHFVHTPALLNVEGIVIGQTESVVVTRGQQQLFSQKMLTRLKLNILTLASVYFVFLRLPLIFTSQELLSSLGKFRFSLLTLDLVCFVRARCQLPVHIVILYSTDLQ